MSRPSPSRAARSATTADRGLWATAVVGRVADQLDLHRQRQVYAAYLNFNVGHLNASGNGGSGNAKGVVVLNGTLAGSSTLAPSANLPYSFDNSLTVNAGATLTLQPGVIVKPTGANTILNVSGTLQAQGTADSPVFITSLKDDTVGGDSNHDGSASTPAGNDWGAIRVWIGGVVTLGDTPRSVTVVTTTTPAALTSTMLASVSRVVA